MNPPPETLERIAAHIRNNGIMPSLDAYTWTQSHLDFLIAAVNEYREAHGGREVVGVEALHTILQEIHRSTKPNPKRPIVRTGWSAIYGEVRVAGIDINRRRH